MIEALIFDAEGVVIDTEPMWDRAQEVFLERRGKTYERDQVKPLLSGRSLREGTEILRDAYGLAGEIESLAQERMELVREQLEQHVQYVRGFPEFYRRVAVAYRTCIGTAMAEDLFGVADRRLGLSRLFEGRIVTLSMVGFRAKPNPDLFLRAAQECGVAPANCLVLEDAPHGVEAARRAGMKCVGIATTFPRERLRGADLVVDSFDEVELADL